MKYGFVYIWFDRYRKMYYIGCHWGSKDDGYICSSNWMRDAYRRRPHDFKRKIISIVRNSKEDLFEEEFRWLSMIKDNELKTRYYNIKKSKFNGKNWINTTRERISKALTGRKLSLETRLKISKAGTGRKRQYKKQTEEIVINRIKKISKKWLITFPNGDEKIIVNLKQFCRENELDAGCMVNISKGSYGFKTHHGYKVKNLTKME